MKRQIVWRKPIACIHCLALLVLALLLVGCEIAPSPTPANTPWPTLAPSPTVNPVIPTSDPNPSLGVSVGDAAAAPADGDVESVPLVPEEPFEVLANADGLRLRGTLYRAADEPAPVVLLLHMLGGHKEDWNLLITPLQGADYTVLAMDMRGHGATGGAQDWSLASHDVADMLLALRVVDGVDVDRVAVVGASIGANLSLVGCVNQSFCRTAILLSPGLDYQGVVIEGAITQLGERPLLIVASSEDTYAAESSQALDGLAAGPHELIIFEGAGHGTRMFGPQPGLAATILGWLNAHLR